MTKRTEDDQPLHRPPTLTVWDHVGAATADVARAAVLYERRHRFPMDEAASTALFRFAIEQGIAADLLWAITDAVVLREDEERFVIVDSNPFSILLERANL